MLTAELYNPSPPGFSSARVAGLGGRCAPKVRLERRMGVTLWIAAGLMAWIVARIMPMARPRSWIAELALSLITGALLGLAATAADFGGWREPDWRAGLFAFFGAFAVLGVFRLVTIFRRRPLQ